jgi:hypothetical protein
VHNSRVWNKHREALAQCDAGAGAAMRALDAAQGRCGFKLTRQDVFDIASQDTAAGVAAAIIWGFPKGGLRGRWQPFAQAFARADCYAQEIEQMRSAAVPIPASDALTRLNAIQPGVGFATTSKIAYFARLPVTEGRSLIYDSNVILAIKGGSGTIFSRTRAALGAGTAFYHRGTPSYGCFIAEAEQLGTERGIAPEQIETALFLSLANKRSGWH